MRRILSALCLLVFSGVAPASAETYRLDYQAVVLGVVELGAASYEVTSTPTQFATHASLRTSGLARLFDQTDITAGSTGVFNGAGLTWSHYELSHSYAGKFRRILLNRTAGRVASQITPRYGNMGVPPASAAQQNGSYDPLSAVFALGRQIGAARACRGAVLVFDGRQHYRLAVAPLNQGTFNGGGYSGPALQCAFRYEPIAGFSADTSGGNIPDADVWFALPSQAGFAAPLRLTVQTPLGAAQLDVRTYQRAQ